MPRFIRTRPQPVVKGGYAKYRPFVRRDFIESCAYCLLPELWARGEHNFELDHFRPQKHFPRLINDFYNLYYACHVCNRNKWSDWPPPEYIAKGIGFVDLCADNFSYHFEELSNGVWKALTPSARYTEEILLLNDPQLVRLRLTLNEHGLRSPLQ